MHFQPIFLPETAFLKFNFNGMPVADGSFGWRWLVNCKVFGGLTKISRLATAYVDKKRLWLTGLPRGEGAIVFSSVRLFVCQHDNSRIVRDILSKFPDFSL